ncbi:Phosphatidylglycerol/phosphatidylinositol transfer protein [Kappamyces sp. JEL0680]|nr:Phosphatidylglycerol/phosphatidylinositol transfer protein [Kappamyces sp. JEL0680]
MNNPLTSCGKTSDILTVTSIDISPYPIQKGVNVTVRAVDTLSEPVVNGSTVKFSIKSGIIPLYNGNANLCEQAGQSGHPCPIAAGAQDIQVSQAVPGNVPSGTHGLQITANNADGKEIACFSGNVQLQLA